MQLPPAPRGPWHKMAASTLLAEAAVAMMLWPVYVYADNRDLLLGLCLGLLNALPLAVISGGLTGLLLWLRRKKQK